LHGLFFMPGLPLLPDRKKASGESLAFFRKRYYVSYGV
jgi:hypothetical protein